MLLFPAMPFEIGKVDPDFADEYEAASNTGVDCAFIDYESLLEGDLARAVRRVPTQNAGITAVLRGWMLRSEQYGAFYHVLREQKGIQLINTPQQYADCHELPGWLERVAELTPETVIVPGVPPNIDAFIQAVQERFHTGGIVIKDNVKSRKHEWLDACYIPDVADRANLKRVVDNFVQGQGREIAGGLIGRRFIPLLTSDIDSRTGTPVPEKWRVFRIVGAESLIARYWAPQLQSESATIFNTDAVASVLAKLDGIGSRFYTADFALTMNGEVILIEVGDGQVSDIRDTSLIPQLIRLISKA